MKVLIIIINIHISMNCGFIKNMLIITVIRNLDYKYFCCNVFNSRWSGQFSFRNSEAFVLLMTTTPCG